MASHSAIHTPMGYWCVKVQCPMVIVQTYLPTEPQSPIRISYSKARDIFPGVLKLF